MKAAAFFLTWLRRIEQGVCFTAFAVMALALIADVLAREVRGTGLFGATQIGVFGMVVVAFLGLGLATAEGAHLRPRFADHLLPAHWEGALKRVADFLTALFYFFVALVAWQVVQETYELDDVTSTLRLPIWPFQTVIVIAFLLGGVRHILYGVYAPLRPQEISTEENPAATIDPKKDGSPS